MKTKDLTKGTIGKLLVKLTTPMVFGMFSMMAFNLVDTFFVSRLGTKELAAMTFTFPVVMVIISVALGIGTGASSVISRAIGVGDSARVRRLTSDSIILSIFIALGFMVLGFLTMKPVFMAMGATADIYPLIRQYMVIWFAGVGFAVIPIAANHALRAAGDTVVPAIIMALASLLNVILDPIMIFGLFGFPRMELAGAALATVISRILSLGLVFYALHHKRHMLDLKIPLFSELIKSWEHLLYIGIPASATNIFFALTMGIITRIVAFFGPFAVAAVGAAIRVESMALIVYFALMTALVPLFGQNWGAGKFERVHEAYHKSSYFSIFWGVGCFVIFYFFGRNIGGLFSQDERVISGVHTFLAISSLSYGLRGVCMIAVSMFNAINMPIRAVILNVVRMFGLYVPFAFLGAKYFGFKGIFAGMTLANLVAGVFAIIWIKNICMKSEMEVYMDNNKAA